MAIERAAIVPVTTEQEVPSMHATGRATRAPARLAALLGALFLVAACASAAAPDAQFQEKPGADTGADRDTSGLTDEGGAPTGAPAAPADDAKVIRTGSLQLQVADLRAAVDGAKTAITGLGGYISNSRESAGDNQPVAVVTYRIPADKWEDGLAALRKLAMKVVGEQTDSADVTSQLVDIDARLKNLRSAETALQEIAVKATRVTDVLEVQARLTEVRGQIESLAAQQKALTDRVTYATVTVTFGLQLGAVTEAAKRWDPAQELDRASASLVALLQSVASAGIWLVIVWLPILLGLAVLALIAIRVAGRLGIRIPRGGVGPTMPPTGPYSGPPPTPAAEA